MLENLKQNTLDYFRQFINQIYKLKIFILLIEEKDLEL